MAETIADSYRFQQRIADGIVKWLRMDAPETVKASMTKKRVLELVHSICDQFEAEDFERK